MATTLAGTGRELAKKVLISQTLVALIVTITITVLLGEKAGLSAACGAVTCLLPSLVFARFAFKYAGASQNELVVRSFSQGAKFKLILTILLFVAAFKGLDAEPLALFGSYAATLVTQWVMMLKLRS